MTRKDSWLIIDPSFLRTPPDLQMFEELLAMPPAETIEELNVWARDHCVSDRSLSKRYEGQLKHLVYDQASQTFHVTFSGHQSEDENEK
jgi:hypothetical protein